MLKIISYQKFVSEKHFQCDITPKRTVNFYEMELYLKGNGATFINNLKLPHTENRFVFAKPGSTRFSMGSFECYAIHFTCDDLELRELLNKLPDFTDLTRAAADAVAEIIKSGAESRPPALKNHKNIFDIFNLAFSENGNNTDNNTDIPYYKNVMKAKDFIDTNFNRQITLSDIAKGTYLSANFLRDKFTQIMGSSPHKYLCGIRLSTACKLLSTTSMSISDIADECGFKSQGYMNYAFKKEFHCTPRIYRLNSRADGHIRDFV